MLFFFRLLQLHLECAHADQNANMAMDGNGVMFVLDEVQSGANHIMSNTHHRSPVQLFIHLGTHGLLRLVNGSDAFPGIYLGKRLRLMQLIQLVVELVLEG